MSLQKQPALHVTGWGLPSAQKQHFRAGSHKVPLTFARPHLPALQTSSMHAFPSGPHFAPSFSGMCRHCLPSQKSAVQGSHQAMNLSEPFADDSL